MENWTGDSSLIVLPASSPSQEKVFNTKSQSELLKFLKEIECFRTEKINGSGFAHNH
ncbi:hypothetical protein Gbfr_021_259 [Gluconobacter frateurii M-2]|nr:hypothetical protein Gbfr_021_259 [Gluconobacter frateurii M-2]